MSFVLVFTYSYLDNTRKKEVGCGGSGWSIKREHMGPWRPPTGLRLLSTSAAALTRDPFEQMTMELCSTAKHKKPVTVSYDQIKDMKNADLSGVIERAFGANGLGLLTVSGIPDLIKKRRDLLPLSYRFAQLPDNIKSRYIHPQSLYAFGWSHGKEKLEGRPDLAKGSYYANPICDQPVDDPQLIQKYAPFVHPNIWPKEDLPEFEGAFKALGQLMVEVAMYLAWHCDTYVHRLCQTYPKGRLYTIIRDSKYPKGRLLHYYPMKRNENYKHCFSDWCGFHNDHGILTALVTPMYFDETGREVACPTDGAGLYVASRRNGQVVRAVVPNDHLALQLGETAQILSGGLLRATPHAVRGTRIPGISRGTFAVFTQPPYDAVLEVPPERRPEQVYTRQLGRAGVPSMNKAPTIESRWKNGTTFAEFSQKSLESYYGY